MELVPVIIIQPESYRRVDGGMSPLTPDEL
jgi:hypothetical protein